MSDDTINVAKIEIDNNEETLYVASHPELHKSLIEGINTPFEECTSLEDFYRDLKN